MNNLSSDRTVTLSVEQLIRFSYEQWQWRYTPSEHSENWCCEKVRETRRCAPF